jgi:hypothetical protein
MATTTTVGAPAKSGELRSELIAPYLIGLNTARRAAIAAGTAG